MKSFRSIVWLLLAIILTTCGSAWAAPVAATKTSDIITRGPWVDVRAFGNLGSYNPSTKIGPDNELIIQKAIDYAFNNGLSEVRFPSGNYMARQLILRNGIRLIGRGNKKSGGSSGGTTLYQKAGANCDFIMSDPALDSSWIESAGARDIRLVGDVTNTSGSGIRMNARTGEGWKLEGVWAEDFAEAGVYLAKGGQPCYIEDYHGFRNGTAGIYATRTATDRFQSIYLNHISGDSNGTALIHIKNGDDSLTKGTGFLINNVKSEIGILGTQQNTIILEDMLGAAVMINGCQTILTGTSTGANSVIQLKGSLPRLSWNAVSADDATGTGGYKVNYLIDDQVTPRQIVFTKDNHFGTYGYVPINYSDIRLYLTTNSTTPSVAGGTIFETQNSSTTALTGLNGSHDGQLVTILVNDSNTKIRHNAATGGEIPFILCNSQDYTAAQSDVLYFVRIGTSFRQIYRQNLTLRQTSLTLSATPSVRAGNVFTTNTNGGTAITNFIDGSIGQKITLIANQASGTQTITHGANIKLNGSVSFAMPIAATLTLVLRSDNVWYETGRMTP